MSMRTLHSVLKNVLGLKGEHMKFDEYLKNYQRGDTVGAVGIIHGIHFVALRVEGDKLWYCDAACEYNYLIAENGIPDEMITIDDKDFSRRTKVPILSAERTRVLEKLRAQLEIIKVTRPRKEAPPRRYRRRLPLPKRKKGSEALNTDLCVDVVMNYIHETANGPESRQLQTRAVLCAFTNEFPSPSPSTFFEGELFDNLDDAKHRVILYYHGGEWKCFISGVNPGGVFTLEMKRTNEDIDGFNTFTGMRKGGYIEECSVSWAGNMQDYVDKFFS